MSGRVVHFEVPADDVERAAEFYRAAFGWDINPVPEMDYVMLLSTPSDEQGMPLEAGSINGGVFKRDAPRPTPIVTIDVADLDQALEKVKGLGGTIVLPREAAGDMGFVAYFTDSEGNLMGLWQNA
ncbi:MAG: VOC family protein [Cryobacterium sp.]